MRILLPLLLLLLASCAAIELPEAPAASGTAPVILNCFEAGEKSTMCLKDGQWIIIDRIAEGMVVVTGSEGSGE